MKKKSKIKNQKSKLRTDSGFTFIELLLYISIVTIVLTAIIPFAWNIIEGGAKNTNEREVFSQARYISERIKYEIRNATDINSVSLTSIDLNTSTNATTVIDWSGGKIRIKYGASGTPINLNSNNTNITSLTFTDYTDHTNNTTKNIHFSFTIDDAYSGGRQEYNVSPVTIESSAEVRSNQSAPPPGGPST